MVEVLGQTQLSVPANTRGVNVRTTPEMFGGAQARDLANGSRAIDNTVNVVEQYNERQAATFSQDGLSQASQLLRDIFRNPEGGILNTEGRNAVGAYEKSRKEVERIKQDVYKQLPDKQSRRMFDTRYQALSESYLNMSATHESNQRKKYSTDTSRALINNSIQDAIANIGNPEAETEALQRIVDTVNSQISFNGASEEQGKALLRDSLGEYYVGKTQAIAQSDPSAAREYLASLRGTMDEKQRRSQIGLIDRHISKLEGQAIAQVGTFKSRLKNGFFIPLAEQQELAQMIGNSGSSKAYNEYVKLQDVAERVRGIHLLPRQELREVATSLREKTRIDGATENELLLADAAESRLKKMDQYAESEPYKLLMEEGITPAPINTPQGIVNRRAQAKYNAQKNGVPLSFFMSEDKKRIGDLMDNGSGDQILATVRLFDDNFAEDLPFAMTEIKDQTSKGVFKHLAGMNRYLSGTETVMSDIAEGFTLLRENKDLRTVTEDDGTKYAETFQNLIGGTYQEMPSSRGALFNSSMALHAKRLQSEPDASFEDSVRIALTGTSDDDFGFSEYNGRNFILPPQMSSNEADAAIESILEPMRKKYPRRRAAFSGGSAFGSLIPDNDFDIEKDVDVYQRVQELSYGGLPVDGNGRHIHPSDFMNEAEFISVGVNQYKVILNGGILLDDQTGKSFIMRLKGE